MKNSIKIFLLLVIGLMSCGQPGEDNKQGGAATDDQFVWSPESFADKKIIRYQMPGFDNLSTDQKKLVYYLKQAGLAGRDITYDQNYRHNLKIRAVIDQLVGKLRDKKSGEEWDAFMLYAKNVWFSSGIHHHYSNDKFIPGFSRAYFVSLMEEADVSLPEEILEAMFNPFVDSQKINQAAEDLVLASAVNFYDPDITQAEVETYFSAKKKAFEGKNYELGLNSKLVRASDGSLKEEVYHANGLYGAAIKEIIGWLEKATTVAENDMQKKALELLIEYYQTGDLEAWMKYNIAWVNATEGDIDYINSFIEVYNDPMGYTGSYESIVQIKDFEASARMEKVAANAQWFEDNAPFLPAHKKDSVVGISYKVVVVAGEAGDASPSTPIGVNLPNNNVIRARYGSKSVSLGNIINAYSMAEGPGLLNEFAHDAEEVERSKKHGQLASKILTALHEVVGHASGQLEPGVGMPAETLKNYASPLEEARADLVGLYYLMDAKLVELGLVESQEVGKAAYDSYIRNGLMLQLRRIEPGKNIQQAHMRNRQMVSSWAFEKAQEEQVIEKVVRDGKTYFDIKDYDKLRAIFGELLQEVQRIKSQGDYEAGMALIENYGVIVDTTMHQEVLSRSEKLNIPPYGGFINPKLVPQTDSQGQITDIRVEYPENFVDQMLEYGNTYNFLSR